MEDILLYSPLIKRNNIEKLYRTEEISYSTEGDIYFASTPTGKVVFKQFYTSESDSFVENVLNIIQCLASSVYSVHALDYCSYTHPITQSKLREIIMEYGGQSLDFLFNQNKLLPISFLRECYNFTIKALNDFQVQARKIGPDMVFFHGDISSNHILLQSDSQMKICDFGTSMIYERSMFAKGVKIIAKDDIIISPEILISDTVYMPHESDLYSTGITFLMLLGGFIDDDLCSINHLRKSESTHNQYIEQLVTSASKRYADCPSELQSFIKELLPLVRFDPAGRPKLIA